MNVSCVHFIEPRTEAMLTSKSTGKTIRKDAVMGLYVWQHKGVPNQRFKMEPSKIMRAAGHKTRSVFDEHAGHALESDLRDIGKRSAETFGNIVPVLTMTVGVRPYTPPQSPAV